MLELTYYIVESVDLQNEILGTSELPVTLIVSGNQIICNPTGDKIYGKVLLCIDSDVHAYYIALKSDILIQLPEYTLDKVKKVVEFYDATKNLESLALIESLIAL